MEKKIRDLFEENEGILRLNPIFVPRRFGKAGKRLKLHPDDYYPLGMERGSIKERWFSSVITANNGPLAAEDEGMSYIPFGYDTDEKISLKDAIDILKEDIIGEELMKEYGGWPIYSKFFDYENPLFHHVHLMFEDAAKVGKLGKPEAYFFPKQLNNNTGELNLTYFGFDPDTKKEEVLERLNAIKDRDTRITELSRGFRIELGTGWYTPPGVIHAPASVLTYEPQWNSDVNSVYENVVSGEIYPYEMLIEETPEDKHNDMENVLGLLDWEKNTDPHYKKNYFRPPVIDIEDSSHKESWITYGNDYFSAKELVIYPGESVTVYDEAAHGLIFVQGYGKIGKLKCETPTMMRFGEQSSDEFFVSEVAAKKGVTYINSSKTENLVALKHFGPNNKKAPR